MSVSAQPPSRKRRGEGKGGDGSWQARGREGRRRGMGEYRRRVGQY